MYTKLIVLALALGFCLSPAAQGANLILVTETGDTDADGVQDDFALVDFLTGLGHQVDVRRGNWTTLDAGKIAELNAADLIVVSRRTNSGNYDDSATEISDWAAITAPMILQAPHIARGTSSNFRWYWFNSATINSLVGPVIQVVEPTHPIFKGVPLDASNQVDIVDGTTGTGQTSFPGTIDVGSGKLLAQTVTGTNTAIAEWEPGTPFYTGSPATPAGKRMMFCCGTQESGATPQGAFNLTENGKLILTNAIKYMAGIVDTKTATEPVPANQATDVVRDVVLSWTAFPAAATHDVYLGTDADAVANADAANAMGVLVSQGQTGTSYAPADVLEFGQTYYWRIDEVNGAPDFTVAKGDVWTFTVEPYSYPIANVTATASSTNPGMGPENTVNGSGLDADDQHSADPTQMWLSAQGGAQPTWIQFEFDDVYKLDQLLVWNSNQSLEAILGFGAKDVTVEYSADGEAWTTLGDFEFPQAPGLPTYTPEAAVDFGGAGAKYVKLTIASNWGGIVAQYGLAEVRFLSIPVQAREPQPADDATGVAVDGLLTWRAGREAASHQVFLGTDEQAVIDGTAPVQTVTGNSFDPGALTLGTTYYWKVVEVNEAASPTAWEGDVWSFTTAEYLVVDDMESYTDAEGSRIYESWLDGYATQASGSTVGHLNAPFAEKTIVHSGKQSMPFEYNNTEAPFFSEAELELAPAQNWTVNGADTLSLWVQGVPAGFVQEGDVITMGAGGHDIWDNADDFRFAYKTLSGDGSILVKVESIENTNAWAKAGVMIRQSLDADSKFVYMVQSFSSGVSLGWRNLTAGAAASVPATAGITAPQWVKLTRKGDVFTAQYSADGATWTDLKAADGTIGTTTVTMTNPVYIGLCVTSHNTAATTTAVMSGAVTSGNVTGGSWQVLAIGDDPQPANAPADLYVTVRDSANKTATVTNPTAVTTGAWTEWQIPLSDLAGVNLTRVNKLILGVDSRNSPTKGTGMIYIDDIGFGRPAQ